MANGVPDDHSDYEDDPMCFHCLFVEALGKHLEAKAKELGRPYQLSAAELAGAMGLVMRDWVRRTYDERGEGAAQHELTCCIEAFTTCMAGNLFGNINVDVVDHDVPQYRKVH